ncbi:MAG TPA: cation-translocating P-type ATPase, partial [Firmicutes bacterium]|nr:cation-translocating P-type ATPase [Bacillota bacterium]
MSFEWLQRNRDKLVIAISGGLIVGAWFLRPLDAAYFFWGMTLAAVIAGYGVAKEAFQRLAVRQFSISLLVTIAAVGAIIIGEVWEAAAVTWLYILGGFLEGLTLARTRSALRGLVDLMPRTAKIKRGEELITVSAYEVQAGDIVVVLPGESIPVDGKVVAGRASIDTSSLTGEPIPVEVEVEDQVLSGTICQGGYLEVEAERVGVDTTFSQLIYLVAEAQEQKPKVQRTLDAFAQWYTPAVIVAALVLFLWTKNIHLALTFLVIGCPGALVVAAPVAIVAGLGNSARRGILIKGGERLERIAKANVIAFDKTGTLTRGQPQVANVIGFDLDKERVLALAAAAELRSEHHLATAILGAAEDQQVEPAPADDWTIEAGLGVIA